MGAPTCWDGRSSRRKAAVAVPDGVDGHLAGPGLRLAIVLRAQGSVGTRRAKTKRAHLRDGPVQFDELCLAVLEGGDVNRVGLLGGAATFRHRDRARLVEALLMVSEEREGLADVLGDDGGDAKAKPVAASTTTPSARFSSGWYLRPSARERAGRAPKDVTGELGELAGL